MHTHFISQTVAATSNLQIATRPQKHLMLACPNTPAQYRAEPMTHLSSSKSLCMLSLLQAFDAAGRQPGSFIAQAVVDVAVMLQEGSLNATAALVNRKGMMLFC
jgi:hypothetical protein